MRIATNYSSMLAQRKLGEANREEQKEFDALSSGDRITKAAYDPAGLAISSAMKAKVRSQSQIKRNINDAVSLVQVAEGTLSTMGEMGIRLRELAVQAASDTMQDAERALADAEFHSLKNEIRRMTSSAKFNGNFILNGQGSVYDLQVGLHNKKKTDQITYDLKEVLSSSDNFGLNKIDLRTKHSARNSISIVDGMISEVSSSRAKLGSMATRLESMHTNMEISQENTESSKTKIRDTDMAESSAKRVIANLKKDTTKSLLNEVNSRPNQVLKLLS